VVPAYRAFLRRFPTSARSPAPGATTSCGRGTGSGTTGGRSPCRRRRAGSYSPPGARSRPIRSICARLPGVGLYTAAAVASIAFGVPIAAVDTNVRRIVSRSSTVGTTRGTRACASSRTRGWTGATRRLEPGAHGPRPRGVPAPTPVRDLPAPALVRLRGARRRAVSAGAGPGTVRGSMREARGAVVRALRGRRRSATVASSRTSPTSTPSASPRAVRRMSAEGLLETRRGRVRLAR